REDVVPAAAVEAHRAFAKLVEELVHLEHRGQGFDQASGADGTCRQAENTFAMTENLVPDPCLSMALELGQVEVRSAAACEQLARVVKDEEAEVEQAARDRLPVDLDVSLGKVQPARTHDQRGQLLVQLIALAGRGILERDGATHGIDQVEMAFDQVLPRG